MKIESDKKIINNAISAYFMLFVNLAFLFSKKDKSLNNSFVKIHTKTAIILHLMFLMVYIIFISFSLGSSISLIGFGLNHILAATSLILLFGILLFGVYRAYRGQSISIGEIISFKGGGKNKFIINNSKITNEKDKLTLILAYIPFLGYVIYGRNFLNKTIKDITKINLILSLIIAFTYIIGNNNIALLLTLFYIIGFVFINIILITKDENNTPDLSKIPSVWEIRVLIKSYIKYIKIYFKNSDFIGINEIIKKEKSSQINIENNLFKILKEKKEPKISKYLIYIPLINLIFLFFLNSKYKLHIINSLTLSFFIGISFAIFRDINISSLILFPIFYGSGYINRLGYRMPFIYDFYIIFEKIYLSITGIFKIVNKIKKKKEDITLKVGEKKIINNLKKTSTKKISKNSEK